MRVSLSEAERRAQTVLSAVENMDSVAERQRQRSRCNHNRQRLHKHAREELTADAPKRIQGAVAGRWETQKEKS
jgi:hypothetical protein